MSAVMSHALLRHTILHAVVIAWCLFAGPRCGGQRWAWVDLAPAASELLSRRQGRERGLLESVMMEPQHVWGQLMELKDPLNPPGVNAESVTGLDDPRASSREVKGWASARRTTCCWIGIGTRVSIAILPRGWCSVHGDRVIPRGPPAHSAAQIAPEAPIGDAGRLAVLREGARPLEDGPQHFVTIERLLIGCRVTHKEVKLRRGGGYRRQESPPAIRRLQ